MGAAARTSSAVMIAGPPATSHDWLAVLLYKIRVSLGGLHDKVQGGLLPGDTFGLCGHNKRLGHLLGRKAVDLTKNE